ncbi:hypothetical protein J2S53_001285 [Actinopolyspora lacussalsi]|uniref:Peptidase inhibitor family I36 n=1 Tax=Actinopolyspora righensis TaxID=995060 RepID=A0A1I6XAS7_9ACTN|nr:hypothetical protein [Actinopolyspora righensis]MDP9641340.1 hypothetical protein [Actinopolyspora lacussalsi]SFT35171.1 hypothetical protein SAMN04487904_101393 [Actinopolyspora righensis]
MRKKLRTILPALLGMVLVCATFTAARPAAADAGFLDRAEGFTRVPVHEVGTSSSRAGTLSYTESCFGYTGRFRDGTDVVFVDWVTDVNECFGISPTRKIWHTWPNAGRWHEMPGNGRADRITGVGENTSTGVRVVEVYVNSSGRYWCSTYDNGWGSWWNCT